MSHLENLIQLCKQKNHNLKLLITHNGEIELEIFDPVIYKHSGIDAIKLIANVSIEKISEKVFNDLIELEIFKDG